MAKIKHHSKSVCLSKDLIDRGRGICFELNRCELVHTAFVIRYQGKVYSYLNTCPHLKIELDWISGRFFASDSRYLICSSHGALFEPNTGLCVAGPCFGKTLTPVEVIEMNNEVFLTYSGC